MKQKTHKNCRFCGNEFKLFKTTDAYCSPICKTNNTNNKAKTVKKKPSIAPVSEKRLKQLAEYRIIRKEFLSDPDNQICPVTGDEVTEIHHTNGREGDRLNDVRYFLGVSRRGHNWIHDNPQEAREKGWLI